VRLRLVPVCERWRDNWRTVGPRDAVKTDAPRSRAALKSVGEQLHELPPGTPVVLAARAPWARRRCMALAEQGGILPEREYLAFPSADAPAYLVEDSPATVALFVDAILVPPPRGRFARPARLGVELLRRSPRRASLFRALAPGRVVVGSRT
jgi:hypothetical protein